MSGAALDGQANDVGTTASIVSVRMRDGRRRVSSKASRDPYEVPTMFTCRYPSRSNTASVHQKQPLPNVARSWPAGTSPGASANEASDDFSDDPDDMRANSTPRTTIRPTPHSIRMAAARRLFNAPRLTSAHLSPPT